MKNLKTSKQKLSVFVGLTLIWLWSMAWMYADTYHRTGDLFSTCLCLLATLTYILFQIYILVDERP